MAAQGFNLVSTIPSSSSTSHQSLRKPSEQALCFSLSNSFLGTKQSIRPSRFNLSTPNRRSSSAIVATISFPTSDKEVDAAPKATAKWSSRALRAYSFSFLETRKLKHLTTGSDALLLGVLVEGSSLAAQYLRKHGITHFEARAEIVKLLGKGYYFLNMKEFSPFTKLAQRCLDQALEIKLKAGEDGELTCAHLVLGIWSVKESAGSKALAGLGFNDEKAKEMEKFMDTDTNFIFGKPLLEAVDVDLNIN